MHYIKPDIYLYACSLWNNTCCWCRVSRLHWRSRQDTEPVREGDPTILPSVFQTSGVQVVVPWQIVDNGTREGEVATDNRCCPHEFC